MTYGIFDSTGNLVESFGDEAAAREALERFAREDPTAVENLALLMFDDDGLAVREAVFPAAAAAAR